MSDLESRIATIADEAFGPFPVQTADENMTEIEHGIYRLRVRADKCETVLEAFIAAVDAAVEHARGPKGGQHVPFHGDFASAPPSVIGQLAWWSRAMKSAIDRGVTK